MNKKKQELPLKPLAILILIIAFQFLTGFVFAQNGTIRGAIFDESTGEPLFGVSVLVKETSTGAVTDLMENLKFKLLLGAIHYRFLTSRSLPFHSQKYLWKQIR